MQLRENITAERRDLFSAVLVNFSGILAVFLLGALIFGAEGAAEQVKSSLSLCISTVIPSVFPLMAVSGILAGGSGGELLGSLFGGAVSRLFGISRNASSAVILGFICGFPIGASVAARLYERGAISKSEFSLLLTFINNPSASFVIYAVGGGILGSARLGVALYLCITASAVTVGAASRYFIKNASLDEIPPSLPSPPLSKLLVSSVSSAIKGSLNVCAYAAFFSATVGVLSSLLKRLGVSVTLRAATYGIFELVGGVRAFSLSLDGRASALAAVAVCSWSGVSVMMQIVSVCRSALGEESFSFAPMVISKLIQALLSPLLLFIYLSFLG